MDDVRERLDRAPMGRTQIAAIMLCVALNALDGFDVLAISFASPGIAAEWGIDRAALGLVLSMELIGMAVGSILLGSMADRVGRRPTVLLCLVVMASGMLAATTAQNVPSLSLFRLFTGLGIGGMLACTNAMVAEFANARARSLAVAVMAAGYPAGAILGGSIASGLLVSGGWRDVFMFGAIATAIFLPLAWFLLPESIGYLLQKRPADALAKVNRLLHRMGHAPIAALPPVDASAPRASFAALFAPGLGRITDYWAATDELGGRRPRMGNGAGTVAGVLHAVAYLGDVITSIPSVLRFFHVPGIVAVPLVDVAPSTMAVLTRADDDRPLTSDFCATVSRVAAGTLDLVPGGRLLPQAAGEQAVL